MGSIQNTRILRFLLVLSAVILTIFVYASYSTNTSMAPPHVRMAGSPSALAANYDSQFNQQEHTVTMNKSGISKLDDKHRSGNSINDNIYRAGNENGRANSHSSSNAKSIKNQSAATNSNSLANSGKIKKQHHREPTIDVDPVVMTNGGNAADDIQDELAMDRLVSNDLLEEQYAQSIDNTPTNTNSSSTSQVQQIMQQPQQSPQGKQELKVNQLSDNNLNKILDSDVLIPTSNLQKFIENADKILKNISINTPAANKSAAGKDMGTIQLDVEQKQNEQKSLDVINDQRTEDVETDGGDNEALPPSAVMTIRRSGDTDTAKVVVDKPSIQETSKVPSGNATANVALDTTKGILTERIYESGHMNEELNIDKLCPNNGADLKLLILITSAQAHADARLAIRQTWAHYGVRRDVSTAFILGRSTNDSLNIALSQENFIYGDLIRGHFIDSYNNLTLKTISALEWVDEHCALAKYILKTDDDMFINVPKLLSFLDRHGKEKRTIFGRLAKKWKPIRNKKSKYFVSTEQFGATVFPPFTTGPAYVLTNDIVHDLYVKALHQVYLKLEDVFTTGIVAQQLNIKRVHGNEFLNRRIAFNPCNIRKTISVHMIKSNEQFDLWKKLLDQTTKCK